MLEIRSKYKILEKEIDHVIIRTYKAVIGKHDHNEIFGISSAKMSIPFSAALSLVLGQAGINDFCDENLKNHEINSLMKRIKVYSEAELTSLVPNKRAAIVEVYTIDGRKLSERVDYPKGEPENPLSDQELKDKFLHLTSFAHKSESESREIIKRVWNLEEELDQLFPLL
jgi:2-methylcitrate dehydratase PrpD